ncbi:hypothetical protein PNK_2267 [Candidatus Protochlamydia naegleriophila]|uniref:Uncharacterized protein n=1 Tax=Candidatus Protochlamydia naegleriophila TaxID=389348 RepID=A0A0U5JCZ2_9BACT|nr:hypothetical protein PNK_2267 [Candidatus Protochlamydia naegleriophila]
MYRVLFDQLKKTQTFSLSNRLKPILYTLSTKGTISLLSIL